MMSVYPMEGSWVITSFVILLFMISMYVLNGLIATSQYPSLNGQQKKEWKSYRSHPTSTILWTIVTALTAGLIHYGASLSETLWLTIPLNLIAFAIFTYLLMELAFLIVANLLLRLKTFHHTEQLEKQTGLIFMIAAPIVFGLSFLFDWLILTWLPLFLLLFGLTFRYITEKEAQKRRKKKSY
ncbi:hypothetical protein [Geomicrobium sediminis]|uniref:Membrane protein n=1 Tax=Geomicrobium sediminis TaxID=1347788 RepID=A0ABS2PCW8_9BACL|nr:hypothetical protein [Geomicrobium sediminis]MBM7632956.1 putative membrane protein [Geomicrobium sediminis]